MLRYLGLEYRPRLSMSGLVVSANCRSLQAACNRGAGPVATPATTVRRCLLRLAPEELEDVAYN